MILIYRRAPWPSWDLPVLWELFLQASWSAFHRAGYDWTFSVSTMSSKLPQSEVRCCQQLALNLGIGNFGHTCCVPRQFFSTHSFSKKTWSSLFFHRHLLPPAAWSAILFYSSPSERCHQHRSLFSMVHAPAFLSNSIIANSGCWLMLSFQNQLPCLLPIHWRLAQCFFCNCRVVSTALIHEF